MANESRQTAHLYSCHEFHPLPYQDDELQEDDFRDAKSIIELLKENLTLWKEEEEGDDQQIDDL